MAKTNNVYIKKARKKRKIKRGIILIIFLIIVGVVVAQKTKFFYVNKIEYAGDSIITGEYVKSSTEYLMGTNIITLRGDDISKKLRENPYVDTVQVTKKFPKKLEIKVTEKQGIFYVLDGEEYNIVSSDLKILEKTKSLDGKNFMEIKGLKLSDKEVGEKIDDNSRVEKLLDLVYKMEDKMQKEGKGVSISALNIEDMSNIRAYFGEVEVVLGNDENLTKKMSDAVKIYLEANPKPEKYINVNFNGSPDFQ